MRSTSEYCAKRDANLSLADNARYIDSLTAIFLGAAFSRQVQRLGPRERERSLRLVIQARRNELDSVRTCFLSCIAVKVARRARTQRFSPGARGNTDFLLRGCICRIDCFLAFVKSSSRAHLFTRFES